MRTAWVSHPEQMNHGKELKSSSPASLPPQKSPHDSLGSDEYTSVSVRPLKGNLPSYLLTMIDFNILWWDRLNY